MSMNPQRHNKKLYKWTPSGCYKKKKDWAARKYTFHFLFYAFIYAALIQGSATDMRSESIGMDPIGHLGHLAVGTFGGRDIWRSGPRNDFLAMMLKQK